MDAEKWTKEIDRLTAAFRATFGLLPATSLNEKPGTQVWSIAQNIHHLIVINETYFPVLDALVRGQYKTPFHGKIGLVAGFFGKMILNAVQPDRKKKMKTFSMWEPDAGNISGDIIARFEEHQAALKERIRSCSPFAESGVVIASPANKTIVYKLETAFDIIIAHEARHFEQAKEALEALRKSGRA